MINHNKLDINLDRNIVDQILSVYPDVMIIATFWRIYQIIDDRSNYHMIELYSNLLKQDLTQISGEALRVILPNPPTDRSIELFIKNGLLDCGDRIFLNEDDQVPVDQIQAENIKGVLIEKNVFKLQRGFKVDINSEEQTLQLSIATLQYLIFRIFRLPEPIPIITLKKRLDGLLSFLCEFDMQTTHRVIRKGGYLIPEDFRVANILYFLDPEILDVLNKLENFNFIIEFLVWFNQTKVLVQLYKTELRKRLQQISPQLTNNSLIKAQFKHIKNILILPKNPIFTDLSNTKIEDLAFSILPSGRPMKDYLFGLKTSVADVPSIFNRFINAIPISSPEENFSRETENWLSCISQLYGALFADILIISALDKFMVDRKNQILNYNYLQEMVNQEDSKELLESDRDTIEYLRTNLIVSALDTYSTKTIDDIQADFIKESLKSKN